MTQDFKSDQVIATTRSRFDRPPSTKRWYRCRCGRWHGINKKCFCHCGAYPQSAEASAKAQADEDRRQVKVLESLGHYEWADLVRGFLP